MHVFAVVGPSGCGKTSVISVLKSAHGVTTMTEGYHGSFSSQFSNRELSSKWSWIARWLEHVLELKLQETRLLVTDRCPLDVVPYANNGVLLLDALNCTLKELQKYNIWIKTIYVQIPFDVCFERTKKRLCDETVRKKYGEDDLAYSRSVYSFYEKGIENQWDFTINAQGKKINEIANDICEILRSNVND